MKISVEQVNYVAALANLSLTDAEVVKFQHDLDGILGHFDKLNEIDVMGVEPMSQVLFDGDENATLRADIPAPPLGTELALANAPKPSGGYFTVPKVIER